MNLIELCTQSDHPFAHKALERGGWLKDDLGWAWGMDHEPDYEPDEASAVHQASVAWELAKILWKSPTDKVDAASVIGMALYEREGWEAALLRAVEALEVEGA